MADEKIQALEVGAKRNREDIRDFRSRIDQILHSISEIKTTAADRTLQTLLGVLTILLAAFAWQDARFQSLTGAQQAQFQARTEEQQAQFREQNEQFRFQSERTDSLMQMIISTGVLNPGPRTEADQLMDAFAADSE